jgi:release factor glutamine methyltransferase
MTFLQLLKTSSLPPKETEILVASLLHKNREFLLTHLETKINLPLLKKFKKLEKKRLAGWSIAVLIGQKEFYGLSFKVDKNVLVPRPETEMIVDEVLTKNENDCLIIDLGTGSGAIIITLAKNLKTTKTNFLAIDISPSALKIAKQNAKLHKLDKKIKFFSGNLLTPILKLLPHKNLIIAANLPYLTKAQINNSPSIKREPKLALDGGSNGLKYYRALFKQLKTIKYKSLELLIEIDPSQTAKIKTLAKQYFSPECLEIKKDLASRNRLLVIKKISAK